MRNDGIFWGLLLVLFGGLLLMENLGLLPPSINIWTLFWPVLLVVIGARMLLRSFGPTYSAGMRTSTMDAGSGTPGEALRLPLNNARRGTVRFHHGAGQLRIDGNAAPDELLSGTFSGGVEQQVSQDGDQVLVDLRVPGGSIPVVPFDIPNRLDWTVGLNPNLPLSLDLEVGASRNILNLRDTQVKDLRLQTGASATEIEFPARAGEMRAQLKSGAASIDIRIPENVSALIHTGGGLSSIEVDTQRFPQTGSGVYSSPDYGMAANRLDLEIEAGVGAVKIR